ncbi:MAG: GNAT family N-acetyltransferase [Saprospiraceae bacterium]|nr:GNAT family N-acetyltransferase [Saprospiraceae bacterium]
MKFYITEKSRGKGIGKLLMKKSIESAKEMGYSAIYLESLPDFSKAISIYEKQGFRHLDLPMGASGHTSCNIWMVKENNLKSRTYKKLKIILTNAYLYV